MDDHRKPFRVWDAMEGRHEAVSAEVVHLAHVLAEVLPEDDLVFFLLELIPRLDLSAFYAYYSMDHRGQPPFNVPMMVTLLVYSYSVGVFSSRKIALACQRNLEASFCDQWIPRNPLSMRKHGYEAGTAKTARQSPPRFFT